MAVDFFPQTLWTLVHEAADANNPERARAAFQQLCVHYTDAITEYMRRAGLNHDAQDAAQEFLHHWLARDPNPLVGFEPRSTRFRHFLAVCLKNFSKDWHRRRPPTEPLDNHAAGLVSPDSPAEEVLDREIAHSTARTALLRLRESWLGGPRAAGFPVVARIVFLGDETPHAELARQHGCQLNTVKGWIHTMRREYGDCFRQATARITSPTELADELRHLMQLAPYQPDGTSFYATLSDIFR
jgi:DNA-directed RNA polymerase specialized sigma24 family protein